MKTTIAILLLALAARGSATVLSANFDLLTPYNSTASGYVENGLRFTTQGAFSIVTGTIAGGMFGGFGSRAGNALEVSDQGWVGISSPGNMLSSVSLVYGFDWSFYMIELGLMDVDVQWKAMLNGTVVSTGELDFDRDHRSHGGAGIAATSDQPFDQLLIRSTAVAYEGIYTGGHGPSGWTYERGAVIGYGNLNQLAFDNVQAVVQGVGAVQVPDLGSTAQLFAIGLFLIAALNRKLHI